MNSGIQYSIDQLQIKGQMLFAYGWIFSSQGNAVSLDIRIQSQEPGCPICVEHVRVQDWRQRQDVAKQFPDAAECAMRSGWMVYARLTSSHVIDVALEVDFGDGRKYVLPFALSSEAPVSVVRRFPIRAKLAVFGRQLVKLLSLLLNGQFRTSWRKIRAVLDRRPEGFIGSLDDFYAQLGQNPPIKGWQLVIDHDLGGGANKYRDEQARLLVAQGFGVVVLTTQVSTLSDLVIVYAGDSCRRIRVRDKNDFLLWAKALGVQGITYNNAVSFPDVVPTLEWMVRARNEAGCRLVVNVHDYFALCPSQHLINAQGRYCDIPADISECVKCFATNKRSYVPIYAVHGIEAWRSSWALLLNACDEIRLFSEDSARLFLKVYGGLHLKSKMVVVPHQVSIAPDRLKEQVPPTPLHIGVVGNINFEKGSAVVKRLAEYIDQRDLPIRLVLFGSVDVSIDCKCFHNAGPYAVDGLAQLLRSNNINMCFLPSVCPETFSYACQELMELGAPVACFDLGAPPERVRRYAYGRVLASSPQASAEMILQELISFHHSVYGS